MKKRIKVLQIVKTLDVLGGAERMAYCIAKGLDKKRFNITVCSLKRFSSPILKEMEENDVKVYFIKNKKKLSMSFYNDLLSVIRTVKPDIIHTHNFYPNMYGRLLGKMMPRAKIAIHEHGTAYLKTRKERFIDKCLIGFTDMVLAVSMSVVNSLVDIEGIPPSKITLLPNGVDLNEFNPANIHTNDIKKSLGIPSSSKIVGMVARLHKHKDHETLLYAMSDIIKNEPETTLVLVGDGPEKKKLQKLSEKLTISKNVIFTGYRKDVPELTSLFDIAVLSSKTEGFGISLLEAMAMEKPVVATSTGGTVDIVADGVNGFLVPPCDTASLKETIIKILKDESLARRFGLMGRRIVEEKFSMDKTIQNLEYIYETL